LLVFKKGSYERGRNKDEVPLGTRFRPNPWEFWHGWQRFEDGAVADLKICRFFQGEPCSRDELSEGEWEENYRIVMMDEFGELVTFSTLSYGGKLAWEELLEAYRADIEHPDLWPVVVVKCAYYDTKTYKRIPRPHFEIVGWDKPWAEPIGVLPAPDKLKTIEGPKPSSKKAEGTGENFFDDELDDEIRF
jgi:hypothetical protein